MVEKFLPFVSQLIDENTFKKEDIYYDNTLNIFFQYFFQLQKYSDGKNYFLQFAKFLPKLEFNKIKSYIFCLGFLGKDYIKIDQLLNELIIKTNFKDQTESLFFSVYSFYKGQILLNKENFILACLAFGYSVIHIHNNKLNYIDQFQIECVKRLCLIKDILPSDFSDIFNNILSKIMEIKKFPELKPYLEYASINDNNFQTFELFIQEYKHEIKKSKLIGLCKIILKELRFKFIQKYLKKFTRIKLTKLSQLTNIQYPTLKNILEWKVCKNKINIKFDEVEDIIEIIDSEIGSSLEELREYYSYLTQISTELYLYDKNKIENFKQFNLLSDEEKQRILLQRKIQVANEDSDDDE